MAFSISQTDPRNLSTENIYAEFEAFTQLAVEVIDRWSALMAELARRKQPVPMKRHPVMSFYKSIVDQSLSAEAALLLRNENFIRCVLPLSKNEQIEIANGKEIAVATTDGKHENKEIRRMDGPTLKRVFGANGIRTVHEQAEMIRADGKIDRIGMITILRDEDAIKVGNQKLTWEEISRAARQAGHRLILNQLGPDRADKAS